MLIEVVVGRVGLTTDRMLRLMGLPARARCPKATVRRGEGRIELRFLGPDCDEGLDVDLRLLGPGQDPEAAELGLLAQLEARGYTVERLPPDDVA
jgi:hypothetical protein